MIAYADIELIASIVERYPVYTFNQVFEMELDFINNLSLTNYERAMLNDRIAYYDRVVNAPPKK